MTRISYPAAALCQGSDRDLVLEFGSVLFDDAVIRDTTTESGLRIWVDGTPGDTAEREAKELFHVVVGVLRWWKRDAGEYSSERQGGAAMDEHGNQTVRVGPVRVYAVFPGEAALVADRVRVDLQTVMR